MGTKHYAVDYALIYDQSGNSKSTHSTTLIMESRDSYEAERKIRSTGNVGSNVKRIEIIRISEK